ncbi:hypothetical protein F5Y04DRAFT_267452 [Hypomontagnella monticulosa]|nr:hypothetical protein F5Y04DRAFT_267452 [Hypomontagnella monticulosa]
MFSYDILSQEGILHQEWANAQDPDIPPPGLVYGVITDVKAVARFAGFAEPPVSFLSALIYALSFFFLSSLPIVAVNVLRKGINILANIVPFPLHAGGNVQPSGSAPWRWYTPILEFAKPQVHDAAVAAVFQLAAFAASLFALAVALIGSTSLLVAIATFLLWISWFFVGRRYVLSLISDHNEDYIIYGIWLHTALLIAFFTCLGDQADDGILNLYLWLVDRCGVAGPAFLRDLAREIAIGRFPEVVHILVREAEGNFLPFLARM